MKCPQAQALYLSLLLLLLQLQMKTKRHVVKVTRRKKLWSRRWLLRREQGFGSQNLVLNELKIEDPTSFKNYTRMSTSTFELLMQLVGVHIKKQDTILRQSIPVATRLLLTLRYLATGEKLTSLSYQYRISVPAISGIVQDTVKALYNVLHKEYLKCPNTAEGWKDVAKKFHKLWNFPQCLGALDGKHIAFRARKADGSFYYNYKGFNSIVLLALVDAEYTFIYVNAGCNGRVSDGGVYNASGLSAAVEENTLNFPEDDYLPNTEDKVPYVIIADDAFRATRRLLKPWGQRTSEEKKIFNYRLSRARRIVENAFGILSNKFQVLQSEINFCVEKVELITKTCCVLHNLIKSRDGKKYLSEADVENNTTVTRTDGEWRKNVFITNLQNTSANRCSNEALNIRAKYTSYFNGVGAVSWQKEAVRKFNF